MKKFLKGLSVALLVLVCVFAFAGCDTSSKIKKAYENEGYTVSSVDASDSTVKSSLSAVLSDEQMEKLEKYEIIYCVKILNTAIIIKCPSSSDVKSFLTTDDGDTSAYDTAKDNGYVNGNCYLVFATTSATKDVFKNA
jgi:hypothetical protein